MRSTLNFVRTAVLAAAATGALGFGARQALAGPAGASSARACTVASCTTYCQSIHGPEAIGRCSVTGVCRCLY